MISGNANPGRLTGPQLKLKTSMTTNLLCPCGSKLPYSECCQLLHTKQHSAATPEQLMRSRYAAFVKAEFDYLIDSHHRDYRQGLSAQTLAQMPKTQWLGLQIVEREPLTPGQNQARVTFKAWYLADGQLDAIFEQSEFIFEDGCWFYTEGKQFAVSYPKRNDPCICNSGNKFKHCCLKRI